ncbi:hypothetical protein PVA45_02800 [Entomospira entomophila]|uniref:Lipoprotein n=1 Tax=Entomospira entomophila TaxID=2719988 RepID=A0A968G8E4_9SPIO|nr:hypothetical protein [Entomospira entomophilus]NIZ40443.1 hypothetical protein [Entomospira entomophilus]WDI36001.1 hypothetical protein PVA45_02800 [Entomospira entomophilus]
MLKKRFLVLLIGILGCKPQVDTIEKIDPMIISNIEVGASGPLEDVRIRGYIIPSDGFYLLKEQVKLQASIEGVEQSNPMHPSFYELFLTFFSNHFKNGYDKDLLASQAKRRYGGGPIYFNTNTYELTIEGEPLSFTYYNPQASIFLTWNKKWRVDSVRAFLQMNAQNYEPKIGKKYYILWILEGRTSQGDMIVKILGENIHKNSLYTLTY